jgi:hypothetical protein
MRAAVCDVKPYSTDEVHSLEEHTASISQLKDLNPEGFINSEDEGGILLRNICISPLNYMVSQHKTPQS